MSKDFYRKKNEEIKLFSHYGEQRYVNSTMPEDTGNVIQFIMNRMTPDNIVHVKDDLVKYCLAVEKCIDFENEWLSRKTRKSERIISNDDVKGKNRKKG